MFYRSPGPPTPVPYKVRDVLDDEIPRFVGSEDTDHVVDEVSPLRAFQPLLLSRFGERLTRKTGAEYVVGRQGRDIQRPNVPVRAKAEVPLIDVGQIRVGLTCKDAFMAEALEGDVKAAEAGEKIDETESSCVFIT